VRAYWWRKGYDLIPGPVVVLGSLVAYHFGLLPHDLVGALWQRLKP